MKKHSWKRFSVAVALSLVLALSVTSMVMAAQLSNNVGLTLTCPEGQVGHWHFINNQTAGAAPGILTAYFGDVADPIVVAPSKVNASNQHFVVEGPLGPLMSATNTNLPGRLVLSDWSCVGDKKDPPKDPPKK